MTTFLNNNDNDNDIDLPFLDGNAVKSRSRKISIHCNHETQFSQIISINVGDQLNNLFNDVIATVKNELNTPIPQHGLTKIYEKNNDGNIEYVEDLGDLIDVLDEKEELSELHLYLENIQKQNEINQTKPWSIQVTPKASIDSSFVVQKVQSQSENLDDNNDDESQEDDDSKWSNSSSTSLSNIKPSTPNNNDIKPLSIIERDNLLLKQYGYNCINIIEDTIHGCIYRANKLNKYYAIKKCEKDSFNTKDTNNENIVREAIILHYLTRLNCAPSNNICKFVEFIEFNNCYMLVMEYGGQINLEQFCKKAFNYIKIGKLKLREWRIIVKYIMWQITVTLFWMHQNMNCCHLDLTMDNIMIQNAEFITMENKDDDNDDDNLMTIDSTNLNILICDFGFAEIFKNDDNGFECNKNGLTKDYIHKSPKMYNAEIFNAKKSDIYSLGIILYKLSFNQYPYQYIDDEGYDALKNYKLKQYLISNNLDFYIKNSALNMIIDLLEMDQIKRKNIYDILTSKWFENYYARYKSRIQQKSKSQRERHLRNAKKIAILPYYTL